MSSAGFGTEAAVALVPTLEEEFRFVVRLRGDHSTADVASVMQGIDDLALGAVWATLAATASMEDAGGGRLDELRQAITRFSERSELAREELPRRIVAAALEGRGPELDEDDAWTLTAMSATNQWLKRELLSEYPALYETAFGFSRLETANRESPLVLVVALDPTGISAAAFVAVATLRTVYKLRKERAEARGKEAETRIKLLQAGLAEEAAAELRSAPDFSERLLDAGLGFLLPGTRTLLDHPAIGAVGPLGEENGEAVAPS